MARRRVPGCPLVRDGRAVSENEFDALYRSCPPGAAPGGILARVVAYDGTLLVEQEMTPSTIRSWEDVDALADIAGDATNEAVDRTRRPARLFAYDGDTGECMASVVVRP